MYLMAHFTRKGICATASDGLVQMRPALSVFENEEKPNNNGLDR